MSLADMRTAVICRRCVAAEESAPALRQLSVQILLGAMTLDFLFAYW